MPLFHSSGDDEPHGLRKLGAKTAELLNKPFQGVKMLTKKVTTEAAKKGVGRRLVNVFAAPLDPEEARNYKAPVHHKTDEEKAFLFNALLHNFVFADLSNQELLPLVEAFENVSYPPGHVIIQQGELGDYFYVISHGACSIHVNEKLVGEPLKRGASFGELALMYSCPRAATVTATEKVDLFRVDQKTFRMVFQSQVHLAELHKREVLDKIDFLSTLSEADKQKLVDHMTVRMFKEGEKVSTKGEEAKLFWIVEKGELIVTDIEVGGKRMADVKVGAGDYFGEQAILRQTALFSNTVALTEGHAFVIDKESFLSALGDLSAAAARSLGKKGMQSIQVIRDTKLSSSMLDSLVKYVHPVTFKKGDYVVQNGHLTEAAMYILRSGTVRLKSSTQDVTMEEVGMFGDDLITLDAQRNRNRPQDSTHIKAPYDVVVLSDEACFGVLKLKDCRTIFDTRYMGKGLPTKNDSIKGHVVTIKDFERHTILGAGTFGQVWLVSRTTSDHKQRVYALKIQSKYELIQNHQAKGVVHEKEIMADLHHPFVTNLVATFKDDTFVYMLMDLVQGGELEGLMHTEKRDQLPEHEAIFYTAGIVEGLLYMHRKGYVYRDLKPQNVLISNEGYPIIADFGFAKHVTVKTFTFCGTPLYLAPEIILNRGHNWAADHWSLGILIHEMMLGYTPFYQDHMDQMELFRAIVQERLELPRDLSHSSRNIIGSLLQKKPQRRLGSLENGLEDFYAHPWFKDIDFNKLRHKEIPPPYVPVIGDPLDTSNFEDWSGADDKMKTKYPKLKPEDDAVFNEF